VAGLAKSASPTSSAAITVFAVNVDMMMAHIINTFAR